MPVLDPELKMIFSVFNFIVSAIETMPSDGEVE
jgi:hypothetical protein